MRASSGSFSKRIFSGLRVATGSTRLSRAGNRRMNHMLHIAAVTQLRLDTEGRVYYRRKRAEGKRPLEAIRCLKRRISDNVYRQLLEDAQKAGGTGPGGHCGASQISSAVDLPTHIDTSDQPLPGPAKPTLQPTAAHRKIKTEQALPPRLLTQRGAGMTHQGRHPSSLARARSGVALWSGTWRCEPRAAGSHPWLSTMRQTTWVNWTTRHQGTSESAAETPLELCTTVARSIGAKADKNKMRARGLTVFTTAATAAIPVFIGLSGDDFVMGKVVPSVLAALSATVIALGQIERPHERWSLYRRYQRLLEADAKRYRFGIEPFDNDDRDRTLGARVAQYRVGSASGVGGAHPQQCRARGRYEDGHLRRESDSVRACRMQFASHYGSGTLHIYSFGEHEEDNILLH